LARISLGSTHSGNPPIVKVRFQWYSLRRMVFTTQGTTSV